MKAKHTLIAAAALALAGTPALAADMGMAPPGGDYKPVADLVALPEFIPGIGTLYVQPATLPEGPFLAYDREGRLVSTVYMVPLEKMQDQARIDDLATGGETVDHVDLYYNAGHPGVEVPHYHIVLWHVADESVVAAE